ncbi:MAG: hypothetical protein ACPGEC_01085 [Flavobacteriales bacterium]
MLKKIELSYGLGPLCFGMTRDQVLKMFGEASEIEESDFDEDMNVTESWHYDHLECSFGFEELEDFKLTTISITGIDYFLCEETLIGKSIKQVTSLLTNINGVFKIEVEEYVDENEVGEKEAILYVESHNLKIWFENNKASEVQWGPCFEDEHTINWPVQFKLN